MCGILGYSGKFSADTLAKANKRQSHRGPDGEGIFVDSDSGIGLGHVRLSIIDTSPLGNQPMSSDAGAVTLVFNGEIYNFQELRVELETKGHRFRGHSDTEVLLHLYLDQGEAMLSRLNGIFTFAFWDKRNQSLFVARDGLGVKPFYYAETSSGCSFASVITALLCIEPRLR